MASCPLAVKLETDQIPFVDDEDCCCDGSVSSIGTGSLLANSTSEEYLEKNASEERLWKFGSQNPSLNTGDGHSLNNILDSVSQNHLDYSIEDDITSSNQQLALRNKKESTVAMRAQLPVPDNNSISIVISEPDGPDSSSNVISMQQPSRPRTLSFGQRNELKQGQVSLLSAYTSLSEQVFLIY